MKKYPFPLISLCCLFALISACSGGAIKKTIPASPTPNVRYMPEENSVVLSGIKKVAIFPFADYSHQQDYLKVDQWGGNIKIIEEITDHLIAHGISVTVQEDVNTLLVDQEVIRPINKEKYLLYGTFEEEEKAYRKIGSPEHELANYEHSPTMVKELLGIIKRQKRKKESLASASPIIQGSTVGLTREKIAEIGHALGVDLIIRGRIIEYGFKDIGTLNPLYRGFVPIVIDSVKDLLFGVSGSYGYENDLEDIETILTGAAMGYVIGNQVISTSTSHSSGITGGIISRNTTRSRKSHDDNALEGSLIGAGAGWMAAQHPKKAKRAAVVQVRIYAQDPDTGDVLWSNRVEIEYTPKSNFAYNETNQKVMFDNAVKEGVKALMSNFFTESSRVFGNNSETVAQKEGT